MNGFPLNYWGWGGEDDQLRARAQAAGCLAGGVLRPPKGAGHFHDLDQVQMLKVLLLTLYFKLGLLCQLSLSFLCAAM